VNYKAVYLHMLVMSNVSEGYAVFNMYRHISMKSFVLKQHAVLIVGYAILNSIYRPINTCSVVHSLSQ
jgi:hypothetical protein